MRRWGIGEFNWSLDRIHSSKANAGTEQEDGSDQEAHENLRGHQNKVRETEWLCRVSSGKNVSFLTNKSWIFLQTTLHSGGFFINLTIGGFITSKSDCKISWVLSLQ